MNPFILILILVLTGLSLMAITVLVYWGLYSHKNQRLSAKLNKEMDKGEIDKANKTFEILMKRLNHE